MRDYNRLWKAFHFNSCQQEHYKLGGGDRFYENNKKTPQRARLTLSTNSYVILYLETFDFLCVSMLMKIVSGCKLRRISFSMFSGLNKAMFFNVIVLSRLKSCEVYVPIVTQRILRVFAWMKRKPKIYLSLKLDHRSDIFHLRGCLNTQIDGWCTTDPQEHKILHKNKKYVKLRLLIIFDEYLEKAHWEFRLNILSLGCQDRGSYLNLFRQRGGR